MNPYDAGRARAKGPGTRGSKPGAAISTDSVLGPGKIVLLSTADDLWEVGGASDHWTKSIEAYREVDGDLWFRVFQETADGRRRTMRVNGQHVVVVGYDWSPRGEAD